MRACRRAPSWRSRTHRGREGQCGRARQGRRRLLDENAGHAWGGDQTVTLTPAMHLSGQALRHLIFKPTNQSGATFDIESVRLVLRKEHLATISSRCGLAGIERRIYRESIAARAPETATFTVQRARARVARSRASARSRTIPSPFRISASANGKGDALLEQHDHDATSLGTDGDRSVELTPDRP